jgi:transcriptional regulator with XRE-family HTH domain
MNWKNKFEEALAQTGDAELLAHETRMVQFRFLSEVDRLMEEKNLSKKDLAKAIGISPSYITQLFRGVKPLNLETVAKFQRVFGVKFEVEAKPTVDKYETGTLQKEFALAYAENLKSLQVSELIKAVDENPGH